MFDKVIVYLLAFCLLSCGSAAEDLFSAISAGELHTCGIIADGKALCWGANSFGQTGTGRFSNETILPAQVQGDYSFKQISAGRRHTCGALINGSVVCWGDNLFGELGDGTFTDRDRPSQLYKGVLFRGVSSGRFHSCGILENGSAMCWGDNSFGELGVGKIFAGERTFDDLLSLAVGDYAHSCEEGVRVELRPYPVYVSGGHLFKSICCGRRHTCGILENGSAVCWGDNGKGQIGDGSVKTRISPAYVSGRYTFSDISCGDTHTCGLLMDGSIVCWGEDYYGTLGDGPDDYPTYRDAQEASPVYVANGHIFASITSGGTTTCGLLANGSALCWGSNYYLQLGGGSSTFRETSPVPMNYSYNYKQISAGGFHTCGLLSDGTAMCWGNNGYGQIGNGRYQWYEREQPSYVAYGNKHLVSYFFASTGFLIMSMAFYSGYGGLSLWRVRYRIKEKKYRSYSLVLFILMLLLSVLSAVAMPLVGGFAVIMLFLFVGFPVAYYNEFRNETLPYVGELTIWIYTLLFWYTYYASSFIQSLLGFVSLIVSGMLIIPAVMPGITTFLMSHPAFIPLIPSIGVLLLMLTKKAIGKRLKVLFYVWLLFCLLILAVYQMSFFFSSSLVRDYNAGGYTLSIGSGFMFLLNMVTFGAALFYLMAYYGLFFSLVFGRDETSGPLMDYIPEKFSDKQSGKLKTLTVTLIIVGTLFFNYQYAIIPGILLINLWILLTPIIDVQERRDAVIMSDLEKLKKRI